MFSLKATKHLPVKYGSFKKLIRYSQFEPAATLEPWLRPTGYDTGIKIYNPLLKQKVDFILKTKNVATWYSCGPTVYDSAHIGHASCYVKFDIIRRILEEWFNINVLMVMGITDIDDKIIKRSRELHLDYNAVTKLYELQFVTDLDKLNVSKPIIFARVSDHVPEILSFISKILDNGFAYVSTSGSVYFNTTKYGKYNKFGQASTEDNNVEHKYNVDLKYSPMDFALWKAAKSGEPFWESPWGQGRPGWHIECSAIASSIFGDTIDLHSGGVDLKFPHHENEEAQSCAHHSSDQWVNYWIHSGHLHLTGDEKMSKSLKNTLSISDLLSSYSSDEFRMLCLLSNYRNSVEYSDAAMKNASGVYKRIESFIHTADAYIKGQLVRGSVVEPFLLQQLERVRNDVTYFLADDFNTSKALSAVLDLVSTANGMVNDKTEEIVRNPMAIAAVSNFVKGVFTKWGFTVERSNKDVNEHSVTMQNVVDNAVKFRSNVRTVIQSSKKDVSEDLKQQNKKLFKCCDEFRNDLNEIGIHLEDHEDNSSWRFTKDFGGKSNKT